MMELDSCDQAEEPQIVHVRKGQGRMMGIGAPDNAMVAAVPFSLPSQSYPLLGQMNVPATASSSKLEPPKFSHPPTLSVSMSEDVLWRNQSYSDYPFAPQTINPWEPGYSIQPINFLV
ncbi:hypothetical protein M405DRAFT_885661 [Rhizopogon salebrosus TDB-379]|nr:hypothetical protein M405DRAFT_885661 [Rhizopogon salebrosus TDB-379]